MIKRIEAVAKFLQAARNLSKQGISKDQVMEFAKREFGEVSDLLKDRLNKFLHHRPVVLHLLKNLKVKLSKETLIRHQGPASIKKIF